MVGGLFGCAQVILATEAMSYKDINLATVTCTFAGVAITGAVLLNWYLNKEKIGKFTG